MPPHAANEAAATAPAAVPGAAVIARAALGLTIFLAACGALLWNEGRLQAPGADLGDAVAWGVRLAAPLLSVLGLALALKPLEHVAGQHAWCAYVAGAGTRIVALLLGLVAVLLAFAATWHHDRPLTAALAGLGALACVAALALRVRRRSASGVRTSPVAAQDAEDERRRLRSQRQREALLMRAMILAARVDGALTAAERTAIKIQARKAGLTSREDRILEQEMAKPLTPDELVAACGDDTDLKLRVLAASLFVMRDEKDEERAYFIALAKALGLTPQHVVAVRRKIGR